MEAVFTHLCSWYVEVKPAWVHKPLRRIGDHDAALQAPPPFRRTASCCPLRQQPREQQTPTAVHT